MKNKQLFQELILMFPANSEDLHKFLDKEEQKEILINKNKKWN